jgi:8-oxo-dGTP pyrophosphatase MutT (NUDIX family)
MADVCNKCWKEWISKKAVANAGVVVVNTHGQALLLFKPKDNEWVVPSGGIDKDEYPKDAAVRELCEEASIKLSQVELIELGTVTAFHPTCQQDKTDVIVTFMAYSDQKCVVKKDEGLVDSKWLSLERIDDTTVPMHPTTRRQLWMAYEAVKTRKLIHSRTVPNA